MSVKGTAVCTQSGEKTHFVCAGNPLSFKYIIQASFNFSSEVETQLSNMPSDGGLFVSEGV